MSSTGSFYASTRLYHLLLLRMTLIWNNDVSSRAFHQLHMMHESRPNLRTLEPYFAYSSDLLASTEMFLYFTLRHIVTLENTELLVLCWCYFPKWAFITCSVVFVSMKLVFRFLWIISWWSMKTYFRYKHSLRMKNTSPKIKTVCFECFTLHQNDYHFGFKLEPRCSYNSLFCLFEATQETINQQINSKW